VLALVLVLAVAGASLAASPSFSGNLTVTAESTGGSFTGAFDVKPSVRVDANFAESGEGWSLDARLRTMWTGSSATVSIHRYRGIFELPHGKATVARNFDLGHIDTAFRWIRQEANPSSTVDQIRLNKSISGVDVDLQLRGDQGDKLYGRVQTKVNSATVGAGLRLGLGGSATDYAVYATVPVGSASVSAIYGALPGYGHGSDGQYAVEVSGNLTPELSAGLSYSSVGQGAVSKGLGARATFERGLIQVKASYAQDTQASGDKNRIDVWAKYRGSEDNQAFGDLFQGDPWEDEWYTNVAAAFGAHAVVEAGADALIELYGVWPFTADAIGRAKVDTKGGQTGFAVEARFQMNDKLVLNPFVSKERAPTDTYTLGARAIYSVSENAEITLEASQTGSDQVLKAVYSLDF